MATIETQDTKFTLSLLQNAKEEGEIRLQIALKNERLFYENGEIVATEEMEELIFSLSRFLAGGYGWEYNLVFERAGIAFDLYPDEEGKPIVSREERRDKDCVAAVRLLMRSKDGKRFLGGVYTLLLHRKEIEKFVDELRIEYDEICAQRTPGMGEYAFVGVSPLGYRGCNYWYLDPTGKVKKGDFVWVRMGRRDTEQIVFVDSVRAFHLENAPYNPQRVKQVLRKATRAEIKKFRKAKK